MPREVKGEHFIGTATEVEQFRLDTETVKGMLTPKQIADATYSIKFTQIKTQRLDSSKKAKFKIPNMDNITPEGLIDLLGAVREQMSIAKKEEKLYKEVLAKRFGMAVAEEEDDDKDADT